MIRSILSIKGGVGKTTTAMNLAVGFAKKGRKVLLIDLDGQANCSSIMLSDNFDDSNRTITNVLRGEVNIKEAIYETKYKNLYMIPANIYLFVVEKNMLINATFGIQQTKLKKVLKEVENEYDEIIIDNGRALDLLATNSLCACRELIIPCNMEKGSLDGVKIVLDHSKNIIENIDGVNFNWKLLITMVTRNKIDKELIEEIYKLYPMNVYKSTIRFQAKPVKQASFNKEILINDQKSKVASDYRNFVNEMISNM